MGTFLFVLKIIGIAFAVGIFIVYPFLIAPRLFGKPDMKPFYRYLYAHRGLFDNQSQAPENSLAAFARAIEAGYGIELDVQLSKDQVPVVFHDDTLQRMCGQTGLVSDYTYAELQRFQLAQSKERIPRFEDVLRLVAGRVPLIVELKIKSADVAVCSQADRLLGGYQGLYCIESFNPLGLLWYRMHRRRVARGQLSSAFLREKETAGPLDYFMQNLLFNFLGRPDFIAYNCKYPDILSRRICCNLLKAVSVGWTIQSAWELERARKAFDMYIFEGFSPYS